VTTCHCRQRRGSSDERRPSDDQNPHDDFPSMSAYVTSGMTPSSPSTRVFIKLAFVDEAKDHSSS
jgi:hypothetical protein